MKLTLILPKLGRNGFCQYIDEGRIGSFPLGVLAGMTPGDIEVVPYDERMESIPNDKPADIVTIDIGTIAARRASEISGEYRKRYVPLIMRRMPPLFPWQ